MARRCQKPIEDVSARTEKGQLFVNADGTLTSVQAVRTQRVRTSAGAWVTPDARLRQRSDGSYAPRAASVDVVFSNGGTTWLATVRKGTASLRLYWDGRLPAPVVAGSTLTYPDVLPGADLVMSVDVDGFGEALVVKDRAAAANPALSKVRFRVAGDGLRVKRGDGGSLAVVDVSGAMVFGSGTPTMWDSSGNQRAGMDSDRGLRAAHRVVGGSSVAGPAPHARVRPMLVDVTDGEVVVRPDRALLTAKDTVFPVVIDPSLSASAWTMINSRFPNQSYWSFDRNDCPPGYSGLQCAKVGYTDAGQAMTYRSVFQFNTRNFVGKHVLDAKLSMDLLHSWTCSNSVTEVRVVNKTLGPGTTWSNSASSWSGSVSATASNTSCNDVRRRTEWGLTSVAQAAARQGWTTTQLGLKASTESNHSAWKKFDAGSARYSVTYNSYPNAPDQVNVNGASCTTGSGRPYVHTLTPQLRARLTDPDGLARPLSVTFSWWELGGQPSSGNTVGQGSIASGSQAVVNIPAGKLVDGHTYVLQAKASDGIDTGQPSVSCEFTVDATPPAAPASVTSTDYPADGELHGGAGVAGTFVFRPVTATAADVAGYAYTLDTGLQPSAATQVAANATDHTATVSLTPLTDGNHTLQVWSKDKAGNYSLSPLSYGFLVRAGAGPDAMWRFEEGSGATTADGTGHGNPLALSNVAWAVGRGGFGLAGLFGPTTAGYGETGGPVATKVPATGAATTLRTDANFTVSAWVRLDAASSAQQTVISQSGSRTSAFELGYSGSDNRWRFAMAGADTDSPPVAVVLSNAAAVIGRWTHLLASYNATDDKLRLYVDGVAQSATATLATPFNATGPVQIGRRLQKGTATGYLSGAVDDVRMYARVVGTADLEFANALKPTPPSLTPVDGPTAYVGKPMQFLIDAHGDTTVTTVRYGLDNQALPDTATLSAPGGTAVVTLTPATTGAKVFLAASVTGGTPLQSDAVASVVTVRSAPSLAGTVLDPSGLPVAGATVRLLWTDKVTTAGSDGSYAFTGLDPDTYTVTAAAAGACGLLATTDITVESATFLDLVLQPQSERFGYACMVQQQPFVPANDTVLPLTGDDDDLEVALPFEVPFYGTPTSTIWVSTNGALSYKPVWVTNLPWTIPNRFSPALIAPFWADLVVDASASVRTATTGAAPNRQFTVEWRNVTFYDDSTKRLSFEVLINESGAITFNYTDVDDDVERGLTASIGIESPGGTSGLQYSYNQPFVATGQAVLFSYPAQPRPIPQFTLTGTVLRSGVPVPDAFVDLSGTDHVAITDTDGRFTFPGLEAGPYSLYADTDGPGCDVAIAEVDVQDDTDVNVEFANISPDGVYVCSVEPQAYAAVNGTTLALTETDYDGNPSRTVTLPFAFQFYDTTYQLVSVSRNGYLQFGGLGDDPDGPSGYIDVYFDTTLMFDSQSSVRMATVGQAPHRQVLVEWRNMVSDTYDPPFRVSFTVALEEDGTVTINYRGIDPDVFPGGWNAQVGLDDWIDFRACYYTGGAGGLTDNQAIVFRRVNS
jgi:hypothetical protein